MQTGLKEETKVAAPVAHFCQDLDLSLERLKAVLRLAADMKKTPRNFSTAMAGKYLALLFEKPSLRTAVGFELAMKQMGGDTVQANGLPACYIRPILYRGYHELGVNPLTCPVDGAVLVWEWGAYLGPEALERGVRVRISSWRRNPQNSLPSAAKASGQYINGVLAKVEAVVAGYEEGILLNEVGEITDGSGENIFVVRDGALTTPPIAAGCLDGITRASVMTLARDLGLEVREADLVRTDLYNADEVFFTGTAAEITPIREVDDRTVGSGARGPVTEQLQAAFFCSSRA